MRLRDSALTDELLREMPKAELHMHIESSLEPELMFEIAGRNGIALKYASVEEARGAYDFRRGVNMHRRERATRGGQRWRDPMTG
jgi:adenosine deaminase